MRPNDPTSEHESGDDEATHELARFTRPQQQPPSAPPAAGVPDDDEITREAGQFTRPPQQPASMPPPAGWPHGPGPQQANPGQAPPWPAGNPGQRHAGPAGVYPPYAAPPAGQFHPRATAPKSALRSALADRRWWAAGGAVAVVAILGAVAIAVNGGTDDTPSVPTSTTAAQVPAAPVTTMQSEPPPPAAPPVAPPAPIVAADALPGLLLSAEQVSQRLNTPGMTSIPVESKPLVGTVTPPNCTGTWGPAYANTYDGSGFTALAVQGVFLQPTVKVAQGVVAFPDPGVAKAFFDKQSADWSACKSSHITFTADGPTSEVDVGVPAMSGDVMTVVLTSTNSKVANQRCERALTVRGNVIVDVRACAPNMNSGGYDIASDIAAKIR